MAQIFHKRATTTHAMRAELQRSVESVTTLFFTLKKISNQGPCTFRKLVTPCHETTPVNVCDQAYQKTFSYRT